MWEQDKAGVLKVSRNPCFILPSYVRGAWMNACGKTEMVPLEAVLNLTGMKVIKGMEKTIRHSGSPAESWTIRNPFQIPTKVTKAASRKVRKVRKEKKDD